MGFFSNLLLVKDCDFHINQMEKCIQKAFELHTRADRYISGDGFDNDPIQVMSSIGAADKGRKKIREAYWCFEDGVKTMSNKYDKLGLANVLLKHTNAAATIEYLPLFNNTKINEVWKKDIDYLESECKKLIDFSDL